MFCISIIGYYAEAPTNLTTDFNASGVTLQWEPGNNCTSTVYQVTIYNDSTSANYTNDSTTLHINSNELNTTETYAYTLEGGMDSKVATVNHSHLVRINSSIAFI